MEVQSGAGISGITRKHGAYQRWVQSTYEKSQYLDATFSIADMYTDTSKETSQRLRSRKAISM